MKALSEADDIPSLKRALQRMAGGNQLEDSIDGFVSAEKSYYWHNMQVQDPTAHVYVLMAAVAGPLTQARGLPADVRKQGEPIPGKDVAILKIESENLPTVCVGDDTTMKVGDRIVVLGYPGVPEVNSQQMGIESTLTQGDLSARKAMPGGWSALQTSAEINRGNSGGPAFNDRGEVIGIATFGPNGEGVNGISFLVPITVAKEFLKELNVKPQQSRLSQLYHQGIASMTQSCYKGALKKFKEVSDLSPGFPFIQDKITQSRNAIVSGLDHCFGLGSYISASVGGLLLLVTGLLLVMRRRSVAPRLARVVAMVKSGASLPNKKKKEGLAQGANRQASAAAPTASNPAQDDTFRMILERLNRLQAMADFKELSDGVQRAIKIAPVDPDMALTRARKVLESIIHDVYRRHYNEPPGTRPLENLLQRLVRDAVLPKRLAAYANAIRELGNVGTHGVGELVTTKDVTRSLEDLMTLLEWYFDRSRPEFFAQEAQARDKSIPSDEPSA